MAASSSSSHGVVKEDEDQTRHLKISIGAIDSYFGASKGLQLVKHQIGSYDDFLSRKLEQIIEGFNSIDIYNTYLPEVGVYKYVLSISVLNPTLARPTITEKDGSTKIMMPNDARLRNLTYSASLGVDVVIVAKTYMPETNEYAVDTKRINNVQLGKLPIMVRSKYCMLQQETIPSTVDECKYDYGGYFIVNGNEKVLISQDRIAENRTYVFSNTKASGYSLVAEIRSVQEDRFGVPKTTSLRMSTKPNQFGHCVKMTIHHVRYDIPVFIVFRALGIESDQDIVRMIVLDEEDDVNAELISKALAGCIDEARRVRTQADAIEYIARHLSYATQVYGSHATAPSNTGQARTSSAAQATTTTTYPLPPLDRIATMRAVLRKDVLPHMGTDPTAKALYLGHMLLRLFRAHLKLDPLDDRDSFINKRLDTPGVLLATLFRQYYGKVVKDMRTLIQKDLKNGAWRATQKLVHVVNKANVYKIFKCSTIETGIRYSLATGQWGLKTARLRQGVAQLLNRMTYMATMSHLRRVNTPIEKTGKLVQPRKLHPTQWGVICPSETPEGASVGLVKNLALLVNISVATPSNPVRAALQDNGLVEFQGSPDIFRRSALRIFLNGAIVGTHPDPPALYQTLKTLKRTGILSPFTSIVWHVRENQLVICTEGGRFTRPVFVVKDQKLVASPAVLERLATKPKSVDWAQDLILSGAVEYMDVEETNAAMIAMTPSDLTKPNAPSYTHCELSTNAMLGVVAGCIPFSDHNQAPRNTYQCLHPDEPVLLLPAASQPSTTMSQTVTKSIKDVVPGDRIVTFCPKTYVQGTSFVTHVLKRPIAKDQRMMLVTTTAGVRTLRVTNDHRVMTSSGWRRVDELLRTQTYIGVHHRLMMEGSASHTPPAGNAVDSVKLSPEANPERSPELNPGLNPDANPSESHMRRVWGAEPSTLTVTDALQVLESMGMESKKATSHVARMLQVRCLPLDHTSESARILARIVGYIMSGQAKIVHSSSNPSSSSSSSSSDGGSQDDNNNAVSDAVVIDIKDGAPQEDEYDVDDHDDGEEADIESGTSDGVIEGVIGAGGGGGATTRSVLPTPTPKFLIRFDTREDAEAFEDDVERLGFPRVKVQPLNGGRGDGKMTSDVAAMEDAKRIVLGQEAVPMFRHVCAFSSSSSSSSTSRVAVERDMVIDALKKSKERARASSWVVAHGGAFASLLIVSTRLGSATSPSKRMWGEELNWDQDGFFPSWMSKLMRTTPLEKRNGVCSEYTRGLMGGSITIPSKLLNGLCGIRLLSKARYSWRFSALAALTLEAVRYVTRERVTAATKNSISRLTPAMEVKGALWLATSGVHASRSLLFVPVENVVPLPPGRHDNDGDKQQMVVDISVASDHHSFFGGEGALAVSNSAMGKQAIGVYTSNFRHRFEPGHVLNYPQRPLVSTHTARLMHCDDLPCGMNVIVAIACYTGYNQEDSVIINKSAVDRGLFVSTLYRTIREQNSKNHSTGEEEFFCKPDPLTTRGIKPYNYDKLATTGFVPENTFVEAGDVIIGKCMPHKQISQNKDTSVTLKSNERGFVDKNCYGDRYFTNVTGDGYTFAKVRLRNQRVPTIGDKVSCYTPDHEVLTWEEGWVPIAEVDPARHRVASLVAGRLEYQRPSEVQHYEYKGPVLVIDTTTNNRDVGSDEDEDATFSGDSNKASVSLKVTPEHRLYMSVVDDVRVLRASELQDLLAESVTFHKGVDGGWRGGDAHEQQTTTARAALDAMTAAIPHMHKFVLEPLLRVVGAWLVCGRNHERGADVVIHDAEARKRFISDAMDLGMTPHAHPNQDVVVLPASHPITNYLTTNCPCGRGGSKSHALPAWVWLLDAKGAREIIKGASECVPFNATKYLIDVCDDIQRLCLHAGWVCDLLAEEEDNRKSMLYLYDEAKTVDVRIKNKKSKGKDIRWEQDYVGRVYCCTVPEGEGVIYVRRDGAPVWCGNSRSGQKGTIGMLYRQDDMPFTASGIVPSLIMNPHAIPSRMTVGQLMEAIEAKAGACLGRLGDATPFNGRTVEDIAEELQGVGFERYGNEVMYNPRTGEQVDCAIFIAPTYYQRLKHMVEDKIHCLTPDHDVLTARGWVPIAEVTRDDRVATLHDGERLVYAPPVDVLRFPNHKGYMYHVENKAIDLDVTLNHRMWVSQTDHNGWQPHKLVAADQVLGKMVRYKRDAVWDQPDHQFTDFLDRRLLDGVADDTNAWIQFFGLWLGAGAVVAADDDERVVEVRHTKPRLLAIIKTVAERLGYQISKHDATKVTVVVNDALHAYLSDVDAKKRLPDWVWLLSQRQARLLLVHMVIGYGTQWRRERSCNTYRASSEGLADDVMRLCLHSGWSGVKHDDKNETSWRVSIMQDRNNPVASGRSDGTTESVYEYEGPVHCLQVPGEVFYVRRNGKAVWTGNSRGANGPVVLLTRQPAEGRARDGGLRLGEMELECLWAHGTQSFLKERFMECSDNYRVFVCRQCEMMAPVNPELGLYYCRACKNVTDFAEVRIPYACKLLLQEVQTMSIGTRFITQ